MTAVLDFIDAAAAALAGHSSYAWNKAGTRIRCNGEGCADILDVPAGPDSGDAVAAFARHQAEQLPAPEPVHIKDQAPEQPVAEVECAADYAPAVDPEHDPEPEGEQDTEPAGEPMEQALSETTLARHDAREAEADHAAGPKLRRDTKALTATLEEVKKGDRVSATFDHPRYGIFTVEGTVIKGGAGQDRNQLMVAGWHLNLNARAAKHLHRLTILAPAGKHEFAIPKPSELTEHVGIG
ncbi:hypothetical protein [Paenarthrobacter sp. YJN-5]|uniref:hypothetical protein n=1 Tax=Paenarthrobacter sp. YJN-5 TaxID=2735316 RepID=UPI0018786804|nr:hypothetical protein [Paenarthrobacter sp. YJN-5]QOT19576.1 hypothetical protein HMI59_23410 [Paenarthrobacter sp. YJN-5]